MIKTMIVDDEPLAVEILETYTRQITQLSLVASCDNAVEAHEKIILEKPDLVFLDIQMPQMSGISLVKSLEYPPMIIFTTAFPEFAVEGFELDAVDYLLKPISFERFLRAVGKVMSKNSQLTALNAEGSDPSREFIFVKSDKKLIKLSYEEILFIEGLKDYVILYTDQSRIVTLQTMKTLEEKLPESVFLRVHRSFIVNLNKIHSIHSDDIEMVVKDKVRQIPIGSNYAEKLHRIVNRKKL